jgi:hypothetical protein
MEQDRFGTRGEKRKRDAALSACLGLEGRIILKCIIKKLDGGVDWIYLAHDRDK